VSAFVLLALVLVVAVALGVFTVAEYRPADTETVIASRETEAVLEPGKLMTIVSWNCGYGALGDNADFFMDGGSSVYTADRERVSSNLEGIREKLSALSPDLIILQEVDINSSRSYSTDERTVLAKAAPAGASEAFAYNFNALYVPYPLPPIGHVESGLYTLSAAQPRTAERISLPVPFSWPIRLVNLKRCLLVSRYPVKGADRELVLINLHLEAYDSGEGKEAQTRQLVSFMKEEYAKGNYVIAGGDFNQRFTNIDQSAYPVYDGMWQPGEISAEAFGSDFTLLMDNSVPTCRSLDKAWAGASAEGFQFYLIDGFIVSANVTPDAVETLDFNFACSDHNPVRMSFTLQ
jgi:endonuclease/exonuclease/phosphatase family metal-dependent hydrolase